MKTNNAKLMRVSFLVIVASLMCLTASAQSSKNKALTYHGTNDTIKIGDTVRIARDCRRYETRERIIHWAFNKLHVVRQVNSKYHPDAILLKRIYSWIPADAAELVSRGPVTDAKNTRSNVGKELSNADGYVLRYERNIVDTIDFGKGHYMLAISVYRKNLQTQTEELYDLIVKDTVINQTIVTNKFSLKASKQKRNEKSRGRKGKTTVNKSADSDVIIPSNAVDLVASTNAVESIVSTSIDSSVSALPVVQAVISDVPQSTTSSVSDVPPTVKRRERKKETGDVTLRSTHTAQSSAVELSDVSDEVMDVMPLPMSPEPLSELVGSDSDEQEALASDSVISKEDVAILTDSIVFADSTIVVDSSPQKMDRLSFALRGGVASTMARPATTLPFGYDARFDLQYAHYWLVKGSSNMMGLITGISAGYMNTTRNQAWEENFTAATFDGVNNNVFVQYHVTAEDICETSSQIQVEIPLMLSMLTLKGFYFNIGPRVIMPIYTPFEQVITNGHIVAKDVATGVVVEDNIVYGTFTDKQKHMIGYTQQQYTITVTVGFELGGEIKLASGNTLGLGVYANYGVYSTFSNRPLSSIISVTPPNGDAIGKVDLNSMTDAYTSMIGHLDAGVKLSFNFDFKK